MKNRASSHLLLILVILGLEIAGYIAVHRAGLLRGYETSIIGAVRDLLMFFPLMVLAIWLGLFHDREFMILYLPASAQPLAVILLTQFMRTVPRELEESARIDGAGTLRILWSIYMPLVRPGIATVAILNFIGFWNEYIYALVIVGANAQKRTLQVALPTLQGNQGITDYALVCAGTLISVLPVFLVYIILNRRMEDALVQGAVKG